MAFRLQPDERLGAGLQRILQEQLTQAIAALSDDPRSGAERRHEARKGTKRMRALLQLIKRSLPDECRAIGVLVRDAARALADQRDADARLEALETVLDTCPPSLSARLAHLRQSLIETASPQTAPVPDEAAARAVAGLEAAQRLARTVDFTPITARQLVAGLKRLRRKGRAAMHRARQAAAPDAALHAWRKQVKYYGYAIALLADVWPSARLGLAKDAKRLGTMLGEERDLALLQQWVQAAAAEAPAADRDALLALIHAQQTAWRRGSRRLGERVFRRKPRRLRRRLVRQERSLQRHP